MRTTEQVIVRPSKHERYSFVVRWPGPGGKRAQKLFTNETDALTWAKERRAELGDVGQSFGSITEPERAAVTFWRSFVDSLPDAPPPALLAVLQGYSEEWKARRSSVTVSAAVDSYQAAKASEGLRAISLQSIKTHCVRFARDFGDRSMSSVTTAEISDWILSLTATRGKGKGKALKGSKPEAPPQISLLAKRNHRLVISGLFNYAKSRGWVQTNPVTDAARPKPPKTRPGILRAEHVARFFVALEGEAALLVPFWAVRFFAGIREQEVLRMDWSMIDLEEGEIHLPDTVTKTGQSRSIKIEPALLAFLTKYAKRSGPLVTSSAMARRYHLRKTIQLLQKEDAIRSANKKLGSEPPAPFPSPMPANCARHSFATYHLLAFRHAGETALQLGHGQSPELLHRHYRGIASEKEAKEFWAIRPARAKNVVNIKGKRGVA